MGIVGKLVDHNDKVIWNGTFNSVTGKPCVGNVRVLKKVMNKKQ